MRSIDMQTWPRRDHFRLFNTFNHPHFSMCVNVDLTKFYPYVKQHRHSFTVSIVYVVARASNAIPEFRQRVRAEQVVEHEIVNPGFTILVNDDLFSFCTIEYAEDFPEFAVRAAKSIAHVKAHPNLDQDPEKDDVLYMSPIPWVSFTSFSHPMQLHPADSHAVMDGIHMGRFYEKIQDDLHHPEVVLGGV
jgi:chloramphenicol O-acetyltransferase type A